MGDLRIYVADLAAYNNGYLHGVWIDATLELDDIWAQVNAMLAASPVEDAEEYAIHDYEGFGSYSLSEHEGFDAVHEIAWLIEDYPALGAPVLEYFSGDIEAARKCLEDNYSGCYSSMADYAQEWTENTSTVPETLAPYIDYERMGNDFELSGDIFTIALAHDEVHVFWCW